MTDIDLDSIHLAKGLHRRPKDGMCLMEAVAFFAGEPHSDRPQCVCPVLAAFGRAWNDALPDEDRNRLLRSFIPRLIGTRSTVEAQERRAFMATDWLVRVAAPAWLRAAELDDAAAELEGLAPLTSVEASRDAMPTIEQVRQVAVDTAKTVSMAAAKIATVNAAWTAAKTAGGTTAVNAAWTAAWAAGGETSKTVAGPVAWAAVDVITAAARIAAVAAAATGAALRLHVEQLQDAAVDLYERMIETKGEVK